MDEGSRLESVHTIKDVSRVQIPLSPLYGIILNKNLVLINLN